MLRFTELCSILDPGKPPKTDKFAILGDATRLLNHLRNEAKKIEESNEALHDAIKNMKVRDDLLSFPALQIIFRFLPVKLRFDMQI